MDGPTQSLDQISVRNGNDYNALKWEVLKYPKACFGGTALFLPRIFQYKIEKFYKFPRERTRPRSTAVAGYLVL